MNRHQLVRAVSFLLLTALVFLAALSAASRIRLHEYTLLQGLTRHYLEPGGEFQSLRRFREAERRGHVDIAFLGASDTYRGFDPRIFAAAGHATMNLGSTNQTPLNTYYLAERYLPALSPRLVVLEVGYSTLSTDGVEASRDLLVNTPWSWSMERMALSTWNLGSMAFATAKGLRLVPSESDAQQKEIAGETYIAGGYCESQGRRKELVSAAPVSFEIKRRQLDYLARATELARSSGARVVWVTLPMPPDSLALVANREALRRAVEERAARLDLAFWDFSDRLDLALDPLDDFKDPIHLNAAGVAKFDRAFLDRLHASGYLR